MGKRGEFDVLNGFGERVILFQLMDTAGKINHAIIISGLWIHDTNYTRELPLIK